MTNNKLEATYHPNLPSKKLDAETLAQKLQQHHYRLRQDGCACGWLGHGDDGDHDRHVAAVILASPEFAAHNAAIREEGAEQLLAAMNGKQP